MAEVDAWVDVTPDLDGGVLKLVTKEGTGLETPAAGSDVTVHYTGTLADGSKFDSSRDRDSPFNFKLGKGNVIKGWDLGVATMKQGEHATLKIRSDYGYGASGSPPKIPGGATLIFDIELISWKSWDDISEDRDGSVLKKAVKSGEGYQTPSELTKCKIHYRVAPISQGFGISPVSEYTFDSRLAGEPFSFVCGEEQVPPGLDKAVQSMNPGETSLFHVDQAQAYGKEGNEALKVPPNSAVQYEIELVEMDKPKESWSMSTDEKISYSKQYKTEGNEFFAAKSWSRAKKRYETSLKCIEYGNFEGDTKAEVEQIKLALYLNLAAVSGKLEDYKDVLEKTKKALEIDPLNQKALFRRAQALTSNGDWGESEATLQQLLEKNPDNKEAKRELLRVRKLVKEQDQKDKKMFSRMFA